MPMHHVGIDRCQVGRTGVELVIFVQMLFMR